MGRVANAFRLEETVTRHRRTLFILALAVFLIGGAAALLSPGSALASSGEVAPVTAAVAGSAMPWWGWPLTLFVVCFVLGVLAVLGGVGGGVLFVPIIGGFFPFHMDFVRGAGLLVALSGALAAGPGLLKKGMADLRLAIPVAFIASSSAIVGAMMGLKLPQDVVNIALGGNDPLHRRHHVHGEEVGIPRGQAGRQPLHGAAYHRHLPRGFKRPGHQLEDPPHAAGSRDSSS